MNFFDAVKALLPHGKAWRFAQNSTAEKFFRGLAALPEHLRSDMDSVYLDLFPDTTHALDEWEKQFAVQFAQEQYGDTYRGILSALWKSNNGGQSAQYLESLLQRVDARIKVVENNPIKNPRDANSVMAALCGQKIMLCGYKKALCSFRVGDEIFQPTVIRNDKETTYDIPVDTRFYEQYFFVCRNVVRNSRGEIIYCQKLQMDSKWRAYVEYLILKVKPAQTGALIFIEWIDGYDNLNPERRR